MYFFPKLTKPRYPKHERRIFNFCLTLPDTDGQLHNQILEDLESKSKQLNNSQLLIIHPQFQTFQRLQLYNTSDVGSGGSVNPIPTRENRLSPPISYRFYSFVPININSVLLAPPMFFTFRHH